MPARREIDLPLARKIRELCMSAARKYDVPPVYITAHVRSAAADAARVEVWKYMIEKMGMKRQMVADLFGRDRRRLRASVLNKKRCSPDRPKRIAPPMPRRFVYCGRFRPVGCQLVWNFAIPMVLEH